MRSWLLSGAACLAILSGSPAFAALPDAASSDPAQKYLLDAQQQIGSGNLTAAEIQLKNALKANPSDVSALLLLAEIYLREANYPAAEAEVRVASQRGAAEATTAPLLGRALLAQGKVNELFQQVPPGNRPSESEAAVRLILGSAYLGVGQRDKAGPLLDQAEKLDPNNVAVKIAKARLFTAGQQFDAAASEIDQVLARDPKRVDALVLKAEILSVKGDLDASLKVLDAALTIDPRNAGAHLARASVLISQNNLDDAQKEIVAAYAHPPVPVQGLYLSALVSAKRGKYSDADATLARIGRALSQLPGGYQLQAAVKLGLKQYEQADEAATKELARNPQNASDRRLLAQVALAKGDAERAISTLNSITGADSKDSQALVLMAQAYAKSNNLDKSLEYYQRAATLSPDDAGMQTRLALMLLNAGRVDQGIADLDKLSQSKDSANVAGPMLVLSSLKLGKLDEADKAAREMVDRSPADPTALNMLGMVKVAQKDYAGAEKIFTDVVKSNPNFSAAQRNLASLYAITNRSDDAKKIYQQILQAHPSDSAALMGLGNLAVQSNNVDEAAKYLTQAQDDSPQDPTPGLTLINLYSSKKQWQQAADSGRVLANKFPSSIPVTEALAQVQSAAGDNTGALASARHITELAPKSPLAWQEYSVAQLRSNDIAGARTSLTQALALAPKDMQIKQAIVDVDYRAAGIDRALKTAQTFEQDDPVVGALLSAHVLQEAGRVADAINLLGKTQQAHPDGRVAIALASAQHQQGHNEEAEGTLKAWIDGHDSDIAAHQLLGETYLIDARYDQAVTELETVARAQPNNVATLNNLSIAYQHKNDPRARETAEKAYSLAPGVPAVGDTLGWILLSAGDASAALPYLKSAAAALSSNMDVQYHLAVALQRGGQADEARKVLERIAASNQDFENKKEAVKLLTQLQHG